MPIFKTNRFFSYYLPIILTVILITAGFLAYSLINQSQTAQADFTYYRVITIDHTKVPNTDQANFPVLISGTYSYLATVANGGLVQNSNGYDVGFYTSADCATGKMAWETEKYTATDGTVVYWVKVSSLSHTADTVFYLCYGNSSITTDQSAATSVWDSNYKMVLHMPDGTTLSANDSTSNGNNGALQSGPGAVAGQVDGAADFNGNTQYINGSGPNLANSAFTISFWHKPASYTADSQAFAIGSNPTNDQAIHLRMTSNTTFHFGMYFDDLDVTVPNMANRWNYTVVTLDGSKTQTTYWDGSYINSRTAGSFFTGNTSWSIARGVAIIPEWYHGSVDEVRVSTTARSADWVTTEYNNQNSPSTFYSVGNQIQIAPSKIRMRAAGNSGSIKIHGDSGGGGGGSVSYDNSSKGSCTVGTCTSGDTVLTFSHTTGSGSNRAMAVGCSVSRLTPDVQPNISSVTYAGVNLIQLAKRDANYDTYIWTLPDGVQPATGTNDVVVTLASGLLDTNAILTCAAITVTGVDQTNTWAVSDCTGAGVSATASCTLSPSGSGDLLAVFVCNGTSIGAVGSGLTSRQSTDNGGGACESFGSATGVGGTTNISWTVGNDFWQILGAAFKAASSGGNVKFR